MTIAVISHENCLLHDMEHDLPEIADRVRVISETLQKTNLPIQNFLAPKASREDLIRVHDPAYVDFIFMSAPKNGLIPLDPDTWMNPYSLDAALHAAGAGILAVDQVMKGKIRKVFCNIRPPGHHAERNVAMGFCIFNNIAIAAAYALSQYAIQKIAIVDFDAHHGNGTENIFQQEKKILYCSTFEHPFYPYSGGDTKSTHILNVPLDPGTHGETFREKVKAQWLSQIAAFQPDIIFISAGFDGNDQDWMSHLNLGVEDYRWVTQEMKILADHYSQGRIISMLEGGYCLETLGACVVAHLEALL